jgi:hypothetical protein
LLAVRRQASDHDETVFDANSIRVEVRKLRRGFGRDSASNARKIPRSIRRLNQVDLWRFNLKGAQIHLPR